MTTTTRSKVEELQAEYAEKLEKAEREDAIASAVAALGLPAPRSIHVHGLYGTVASIKYGDSYGYRDKDRITLADVLKLAEALPGVPMTKVSDGCLSFRPTSFCESLPEEEKQLWQEETGVCPVLVKAEQTHGYNPRARVEWVAELPGVGLVSVDCDFHHVPREIGTYHAKRIDSRGGWRYERSTMGINDKLIRIEGPSGEHVAEVQSPIYWASGSDQSPAPISVYWIDIHSDQLTTAADIVRAMQPVTAAV